MNEPADAARRRGPTLVLSVIGFFLVLTSYYVLRPVRDQLVGAAGSSSLPMFYAIVFVVMLALTPVFGWLVSRFARRKVLLCSYLFFVACLVAFVPAFVAQDRIGAVALGQVFFVWVSVFNLFVVSLFWSLMADVFSSTEARVAFPLIAFGGMAGALLGPLLTRLLVVRLGVPSMLVVSAGTLAAALGALLVVSRRVGANDRTEGAPLGGSMIEGAKAAVAQPFLRYMALLMLLSDGIATMAYALMADYTKARFTDNALRTAFYADLDLWINGLGAVLQLSLTPLLMRRFGTLWALVVPSAVNVLLLSWLAIHGPGPASLFGIALPVIVVVQVVTRGMTFGMGKPASDALYTRMPREARYKGKNFIETTVWRLGDLLVTSGLYGLHAIGVGIAGVGLICAGLAAVATDVARRAATSPDLEPESEERPTP